MNVHKFVYSAKFKQLTFLPLFAKHAVADLCYNNCQFGAFGKPGAFYKKENSDTIYLLDYTKLKKALVSAFMTNIASDLSSKSCFYSEHTIQLLNNIKREFKNIKINVKNITEREAINIMRKNIVFFNNFTNELNSETLIKEINAI